MVDPGGGDVKLTPPWQDDGYALTLEQQQDAHAQPVSLFLMGDTTIGHALDWHPGCKGADKVRHWAPNLRRLSHLPCAILTAAPPLPSSVPAHGSFLASGSAHGAPRADGSAHFMCDRESAYLTLAPERIDPDRAAQTTTCPHEERATRCPSCTATLGSATRSHLSPRYQRQVRTLATDAGSAHLTCDRPRILCAIDRRSRLFSAHFICPLTPSASGRRPGRPGARRVRCRRRTAHHDRGPPPRPTGAPEATQRRCRPSDRAAGRPVDAAPNHR